MRDKKESGKQLLDQNNQYDKDRIELWFFTGAYWLLVGVAFTPAVHAVLCVYRKHLRTCGHATCRIRFGQYRTYEL